MKVLQHVPIALYTYGLCYYGHHGDPYKTIEVEADSKLEAQHKAYAELKPGAVQSICYVSTAPNSRYDTEVRQKNIYQN